RVTRRLKQMINRLKVVHVALRSVLRKWVRTVTSKVKVFARWLLRLAHRVVAFGYSFLVFQLYFWISYQICGRSSERLYGRDGVYSYKSKEIFSEPADEMWGNHYLWFFFGSMLALSAAGCVAGIVTPRLTQLKAF